MAQPKRPPTKSETLVSLAVLGALAGITAVIVARQVNYTSPFLTSLVPTPAVAPEIDLSVYAPEGVSAMSAMESFTPETLYEKINGRADLYLTAGMVAMRCQRFGLDDQAEAWMEVFVYDMADADNAFTVYSKQKRPGVQELAELAYRTSNSLHFVHGRYYVEIVSAAGDEPTMQAMETYRERFCGAVAAGTGPAMDTATLFPPDGLRAGSLARAGAEDFGIKGFDNTFLATYTVERVDVTAFLARRASAEAATAAAEAYCTMFQDFGGQVAPVASIPGGSLVTVLDTYKVVFARGPFVAGVHESADRAAAVKVAERLDRALAEEVE